MRIKLVLEVLLVYCATAGLALAGEIKDCPENLLPIERTEPKPYFDRGNWADTHIAVLEFTVDRNGVPKEIAVVESSNREFERAALDAVVQWRFPKREKICLYQIKLTYTVEM